jgi:probable HAF family extracellular repeat protein
MGRFQTYVAHSFRIAAATAIAVFCYPLVTVGAAPQYTITALDIVPGGVSSLAVGLNDDGDIVGHSALDSTGHVGQQRPVRWDRSGAAQELWTDRLVGGNAKAINNRGQVAGRYGVGSGIPLPTPGVLPGRAFVWDATSGRRDIGLDPFGFSQADAINDLGQVAGTAEVLQTVIIDGVPTETYIPRAFIWDIASGSRDLGTIGGYGSFAMDINEHGQVVGHADTIEGFTRAIIWDEVNGMQQIGTSSGESRALAINDVGQVIVNELGAGTFVWDRVAGLQPIPIGALDLNNQGQVLGGVVGNPAIWDSTNGVQLLSDLIQPNSGWQLEIAFALNDAGEISGYGILGGQVRGFLLTPVPEPTTAILIASSIVLVSFWRLRRLNRRS